MFYIYCYENKINGKRYIGKTNNLARRKSRHRRNAFVDNYTLPFYNALRKYGEDGFLFSILDSFNSEDIILDLEKFYISGYRSNNLDYGYNLTPGGEGSVGIKHNINQIASNKLKFGGNNGNSRLNDNLVLEIYTEYLSGKYTYLSLSNKYLVSPITIERILSGKSWKHLNLDLSKLIDVKLKNNHNHLVFNKETK